MQATQCGGLSGKARFNRHRNRVQRMYTQQMMEEYLEAEEYEIPTRPVPLRGRAEFLPTIDSWSQEDAVLEMGSQMELRLQAADDPGERLSNEVVELQRQIEMEAGALVEKAAAEKVTAPTVKVIPAPYWARPRIAFQPQGRRVAVGTFDFRRFAYGCALGTAAAAAILLVVGTVFH